jgi:hypothetical protein
MANKIAKKYMGKEANYKLGEKPEYFKKKLPKIEIYDVLANS